MKRTICTIGIGILLLFVLTAMVSGKRVVTDNKTPAKQNVETTPAVASSRISTYESVTPVHEDVHQPQATGVLINENEPPLIEGAVGEINVPAAASAMEPGAYDIPWQSINAGGDDLSSDNYQMSFSVGQSVIGHATSENYEAGIGYWYGAGGNGGPCDCGLSGDVNHDASTDPLDVSYLVNKVFLSQDALYDYTATCSYPNGDVNCDGSADPLDVSYLVNKVFLSQDALCDRCP